MTRQILTYNFPPQNGIYERCRHAFGESVDFDKGTVFTYDGCVYSKNPMDDALFKHECTHVIQQDNFEGGAEAWWDKYLEDDQFRLSQELEAYQIQYQVACQSIKDRNKRLLYLVKLGQILSHDMYGNIISTKEAINLIKKGVV